MTILEIVLTSLLVIETIVLGILLFAFYKLKKIIFGMQAKMIKKMFTDFGQTSSIINPMEMDEKLIQVLQKLSEGATNQKS